MPILFTDRLDPGGSQPNHAAELLTGMLNSAVDAIITVDEQQRIVFYNPAAEEAFGWSRQEILWQTLDRLLGGEFFKIHVQPLAQANTADTASRQTGVRAIACGLHRSGEAFSLDASVSQLDTPAGKLFTVIARRVADAHWLEEEKSKNDARRHEDQRQLLAAQQAARIAYWQADLQARQIWWSDEAHRVLGVDRARLDGSHDELVQLIHPEDRQAFAAERDAAIQSGLPLDIEFRVVTACDEVRWIHLLGGVESSNKDPWRHCRAGVVREIVHRRHPQNTPLHHAGDLQGIGDLKATQAALRLSNEEFATFSYSVSHGLRAPLNIINGFSHLLAKKLAASEGPQVQHYLSRIQGGATHMGQLIEALLALSQVSRTQLRSESLDLSAMACGILEKWQAHEPGRQVTVHIESGLCTQGDDKLVRVVMQNLLDNAWKFTSQKASAEITVGRQPGADEAPVFFVRDNGAGFDMAYADKLFKPFQRLHAVPEFPGSGMGLVTASRVITRHGGRLWAESAPDCGASFFFTLPG